MKKLIVIDISNFIFRAFYAIRPLSSPSGLTVNAVYGVFSMLLKILAKERPTHLVIAKDTSKEDSFRKKLFADYKAHRQETPEALVPQFPIIFDLLEKMKIKQLSQNGFEADDVIGTIATRWKDSFDEILIASGDKDLMQFVGDKIKILDTMKDKVFGIEDVYEKMGVYPNQIVDYLSLLGDSSDNIPGMKGIGAKGAAKLLEEYGTLDKCIENKGKLKNKKMVEAFENHLDECLLSKKLVEIDVNVDLMCGPEDTLFKFYPSDELMILLGDLGFKSFIAKMKEFEYMESFANKNVNPPAVEKNITLQIVPKADTKIVIGDVRETIVLNSKDDFFAVISEEEVQSSKNISFYYLFAEKGVVGSSLARLTFCKNDKMYSFGQEFLSNCDQEDLYRNIVLPWFKRVSDANHILISHDIKRFFSTMLHCLNNDINTCEIISKIKFEDISQMHYIVDPSKKHSFEQMLQEMCADFVITEDLAQYTYVIEKIFLDLQIKLEQLGSIHVYNEIDRPLIPILSMMESNGIKINPYFFQEFEKDLEKDILKIKEQIVNAAYETNQSVNKEINLNSSKQVAELLFSKLNLPVIKNNKTGPSTDVEVLEELSSLDKHIVPTLLLKYRELEKLLTTYVRPMPELINSKTKRIHTEFHQNIVQTGRLSSTNPNLQNIPVRSEAGKKVRKGVVAKAGSVLISADYSQIELRILAHMSSDPVMVSAFLNNVDIHKQTAAEVLKLSISEVTSSDRDIAKSVNFGLMYGQSSFGLSKAIGISRSDAKDYITKYFERFNQVKIFLDSLKENCEKTGYVETMLKRKRFLPDIHSQNRTIKSQAERMAINAPIQGTAADIIKMAMINIQKKLQQEKLECKLLLQVHDELIFELPEEELMAAKQLIKFEMENVIQLKVPLTVNVSFGVNWYDLK